jgi:hypothetical protein
MIIRKRKKKTGLPRMLPAGFLTALLALGLPASLRSEQTVKFRLYPGFEFPLEDKNYGSGLDLAAALDWRFFPFLGASGQFGYLNVPVTGSGNVQVMDASFGPLFVWRPLSRLSFKADITGGLYQATWDEKTISGISFGGRVSAALHISPSVSGMIFGSYKQYAYTPKPFLNTVTVGVGISLDLGEMMGRKVRIDVKKIDQRMVFPVSYAWYNENAFATVRITNN